MALCSFLLQTTSRPSGRISSPRHGPNNPWDRPPITLNSVNNNIFDVIGVIDVTGIMITVDNDVSSKRFGNIPILQIIGIFYDKMSQVNLVSKGSIRKNLKEILLR